MEEIEKERKQMEDAIGFHNFINFLSQTVRLLRPIFALVAQSLTENLFFFITEKANRWPQHATRCDLHYETVCRTSVEQIRSFQNENTQNLSEVS